MKQCPQCNTSCDDADIVCKNCGYLFNTDSHSSAGDRESADPSFTQSQPNTFGGGAGQQPVNSYGNQKSSNNGFSIASFVLGLIGLITSCCYGFGILPSIPGLIFGIIASNKIKKSGENGKSFAIAGIILSILGIAFAIAIFIYLYLNWDVIYQTIQNSINQATANAGSRP